MHTSLHTSKIFILFFIVFAFSSFANINIGNPVNITECFQNTTEGFDLTLNNSNVLDGLDPNLYSIYYFDNQADSNTNNISNSIADPTNYSTGSFGLAQVWVNVVEDADETNFDNSTFLLISNQQPIANEPLNANINLFLQPDVFFIGIDEIDNNFYNLNLINPLIIDSQTGSFNIQYFESLGDANNNINPIQDPENFFIDPADGPQHVINMSARIEFTDSSSCFDTINFNIYVFNPQQDEFNTNDFSVCANPNGTTSVNIQEQVLVDTSKINFQFDVVFLLIDEDDIPVDNFNNQINGTDPVNIGITYRLVYPSVIIYPIGQGSVFNTLTIFPSPTPQVQQIQDISACSTGDEEITFDLTQNDALALGNQTGNFSISYHLTLPEANEGINSVSDLGFDPTEFTLDNFQQFMFLRIENADDPSCFSVDFFTLEDAGNLTAVEPENTEFCAPPNQTSQTVDLTNFDADVINNQAVQGLFVEYFFDDELITSPTEFLLENETTSITAVLTSTNFNSCSDEVIFDVFLKQTPEIQNLNNLQVCSEYDFTTTFDLTENASQAIGTQDESEIEVQFFTSLTDAENNENSLTSQAIDMQNYPVFEEVETIFIRLQNANSSDCFAVDSFELQSFPVEINEVSDLVSCTEEGVTSAIFDLTEIESELLPEDADASDYEIAYFDEADDEITDPTNYEITSDESILVEVTNLNNSDCLATTTFNVNINVTPEIQNLNDLQVCSDFDFTATFDLTENASEAIGTQDESEIEVQFFTSLADAENNENSLTSQEIDMENYPVFEEVETIFIRLQNVDSSDCFAVDSFELQSFPTEINEVPDLVSCTEEGVDNAIFDLTEIESELFPEVADASDYEIAYFDEADDEIIDPPNYEITSNESILVEVTNLNNSDCVATTTFNVNINVTPEIQNLNDLQVCSDFDFTATFDLTENASEAIGTQDESEIEVQFFTSLADAENNENSLSSQGIDMENYPVFEEVETIFIRLQNSDSSDCFAVDSFELQSFPTEINEVPDLVSCSDEGVDNVIFDLTEIESELFPDDADASDYEIAYFDEADDEITDPTNYEITSNESILVEVTNLNNSDCVATITFGVSIIVTPEIQNLNDLQVCSDFDFTATFDLTENASEAIGTQDESEIEVQFFTSLADAENNENSFTSQEIDMENYPVFEEVETIFIRLQNANSSDCFAVDSFELQSFPVEINEVSELEECIDPDTLVASFNLQVIEATLLGVNQDSSLYSVAFFDENDVLIENTSDYTITDTQNITAEVFSLTNTECFQQTSISLVALSPDDVDCTLSLEDHITFEFSIYPNPVVGQLTIDSNQPITQVEIFDIKGKQVHKQHGMDIQYLNFSNYPSGIYLLKLETESNSQIVKIIRE